VYLDASAVNVLLFGKVKEPGRYTHVRELFRLIDSGEVIGVVSFHTMIEVYWFCVDNFPSDEAKERTREALSELLSHRVEIVPLLDRKQKILLQGKITIADSSDLPHVGLAHVYNCNFLIAYDDHFKTSSDMVQYLLPEELVERLRQKNSS
jgi:predicted nucleic acid-binding protein